MHPQTISLSGVYGSVCVCVCVHANKGNVFMCRCVNKEHSKIFSRILRCKVCVQVCMHGGTSVVMFTCMPVPVCTCNSINRIVGMETCQHTRTVRTLFAHGDDIQVRDQEVLSNLHGYLTRTGPGVDENRHATLRLFVRFQAANICVDLAAKDGGCKAKLVKKS